MASTTKSLSYLSISLIFYFLSLLIEGKYRIDFINNHFYSDYIYIIKLSSNVNMVITSLFAILFIIITLIICYLVIEVFKLKTSINSVVESFISLVLIFILFQIIRFLIDLMLLKAPDTDLLDSQTYINSFKETKWFQYLNITNFLMIFVGIIVFGIELYTQEKKKYKFEIIILSSVIIIGYFLTQLQ